MSAHALALDKSTDARPFVALARRCNNACIFCAQPSFDGASEEISEGEITRALERVRTTADEVTFTGGEPTLLDDLVSYVERARALGFTRVGLQTNARRLATESMASRLARAGLTDVHVSVHGSEPAVHDYHTAMAGSLVQTLAGIGAARAAKLRVVATTVLTRSNYRSLSLLPRLLSTRGVSAWHVAVPWARGRAATSIDRVIPRIGLAMPFVLHAISSADKLGLPSFVSGAPLCVLGPFADRSLDSHANAPRAYAPACASCAARTRCPGVDPWYLARFSGDELSARADVTTKSHPLSRLFTGPGELAPVVERVVPESPRESRRKLPVLSRPSPGASEARRGPSKSGDALREIFPALFDPKGED